MKRITGAQKRVYPNLEKAKQDVREHRFDKRKRKENQNGTDAIGEGKGKRTPDKQAK